MDLPLWPLTVACSKVNKHVAELLTVPHSDNHVEQPRLFSFLAAFKNLDVLKHTLSQSLLK